MKAPILTLLLLIPTGAFPLTVEGTVYRRDTMSAGSGAVFLKLGGILLADGDIGPGGTFKLSCLDSTGMVALDVRVPGCYPELRSIAGAGSVHVTVYATPRSGEADLAEIEVLGRKEKAQSGVSKISLSDRRQGGVTLGSDPLQSLRRIPGVVSGAGEYHPTSVTRLSVRGGSASENAAYLDDAFIEFPYHRSWFSDSIFIDGAVGDLLLEKGVFSVRYGNAVSGLLRASTAPGAPPFHGRLDLGMLTASLTMNGASESNAVDWTAGVRRANYDVIIPLLAPINQDLFRQAGADFFLPAYYDGLFRITWRGKEDTLTVLSLATLEPAPYTTNNPAVKSGFEDNHYMTGAATWKHSLTPTLGVSSTLQAMTSWHYLDMRTTNAGSHEETWDYSVSLRSGAYWTILPALTLRAGGEGIWFPGLYSTNYTELAYLSTNGIVVTNNTTAARGYSSDLTNYGSYLQGALYAETEWEPVSNFLTLRTGVRWNASDLVGKTAPDPRATLEVDWKQGRSWLSAGALSFLPVQAATVRTIQALDRSDAGFIRCAQAGIGTEYQPARSVGITAELFGKHYFDLPSRERQALTNGAVITVTNLLRNGLVEREIAGAEVLLRKDRDAFPLWGWASFSSAWVWNRTASNQSPLVTSDWGSRLAGRDSITQPAGVWYTGKSLDYRVNAVVIWDFSRQWAFTAEFNWRSGDYYTPVAGFTNATNGAWLPVAGAFQSARLPDVHQLNLSAYWSGDLFDVPCGASLTIQNIYNSHTTLYYSYTNGPASPPVEIQFPLGIFALAGFWLSW